MVIHISIVGDNSIASLSVHDDNWLVKYGKKGIASEDLYAEELESIRTNPYSFELEPVFGTAGINFGRADFAFVNGRMQVYEINTNPFFGFQREHPYEIELYRGAAQ